MSLEDLYPKKVKDNLIFRINIAKKCEDSDKHIAHLKAFLSKDIIHFFNLCLLTYDPRKTPKHRPFILYPFQEELVRELNEHIEQGKDCLVEKSRDMGVTWCVLGVFLYRWLFHSESFLIGSRKEEMVDKLGDIDTLFERLRYMLKSLFPALIEHRIDQAYMKITNRDEKNVIIGESMNIGFSRQGRFNSILLDEFAFVDQSSKIWQACGDSAPARIAVSTPNGKRNFFADLRFSGKIKVNSLHWTLHPEKDDVWYENEKLRRSEREIAQELDMSYIASAGKPYYSGFRKSLHTGKFSINTHKGLIFGWDYGYHHPNCLICQEDSKGRFIVFDNVFGHNEIIQNFRERVKAHLNSYFPNFPFRCFGDPAGNQKSDKNEQTSVDLLREAGFGVVSRFSTYRQRKEIIEKKLKNLIDGIPALVINENKRTQILIEAFEGGYHYPEEGKTGVIREEPEKDGYYDHVVNCLEYIMVNLYSPFQPTRVKRTARKVVAMDNI